MHVRLSDQCCALSSFDVKADIADYARSTAGLMKVKTVCPGGFISNFWTINRPHKINYQTFIFSLPLSPETPMPNIDIAHDFGRFVVAATREGSPDELLAGGHYQSLADSAKVLSDCKYHRLFSRL